jgi:hypothetical protein
MNRDFDELRCSSIEADMPRLIRWFTRDGRISVVVIRRARKKRGRRGVPFVLSLRNELLWLWHDADVGLRRFPALRIELLRLFIADRAAQDDILALFPVGWRRNAVLCAELQ